MTAFRACSSRCLAAHIASAHPEAASSSSEQRARRFFRDLNARFPDTRDRYLEHRDHVTALVTSVPTAGSICILGAGNGSDIDLPGLARTFERIDLVDLDGDALARFCDRTNADVRSKLMLHGDVDLTGMIDRLDTWGDTFPEASELARHALGAAHALVQSIGRTFDVTLSTCVLSQLPIAFQRAWILPGASWANLIGAIRAVHLATLAGLTRPGGTGVIVFDVLSSREAPALDRIEKPTAEALEAQVREEVARGAWNLRPDPHELAREIGSPGRAALIREPRVVGPWLWDLGESRQVVYAIVFTRA
jgi:hypothetical protein